MSIVNTLALESNRQIKIAFDRDDFSSDASVLLINEFINKLDIDKFLKNPFKLNDSVHYSDIILFRKTAFDDIYDHYQLFRR